MRKQTFNNLVAVALTAGIGYLIYKIPKYIQEKKECELRELKDKIKKPDTYDNEILKFVKNEPDTVINAKVLTHLAYNDVMDSNTIEEFNNNSNTYTLLTTELSNVTTADELKIVVAAHVELNEKLNAKAEKKAKEKKEKEDKYQARLTELRKMELELSKARMAVEPTISAISYMGKAINK